MTWIVAFGLAGVLVTQHMNVKGKLLIIGGVLAFAGLLAAGCVVLAVASVWPEVDYIWSEYLGPTSTPSPAEVALRQEVAARLGVAADWHAIDAYVSHSHLTLGLTREEVHARLSSIGSFEIEKEEHYYYDVYARRVIDELTRFEDPVLSHALGRRGQIYDAQTKLLIETYVILPSGEVGRVLPPPP